MELFDELYSTYYHITGKVLEQAAGEGITKNQMEELIFRHGFEETPFHLMPKLTEHWPLLQERDGRFYSKLKHPNTRRPVTLLEKMWLRALLRDPKMQLFLDHAQRRQLARALWDVPPLYTLRDFSYFDRCEDGDCYSDLRYQQHFRKLLWAIHHHQILAVTHKNAHRRTTVCVLPWRLVYSQKDDKFRLLGVALNRGQLVRAVTINLQRITQITKRQAATAQQVKQLDKLFHNPIKKTAEFEISTERNALERCMLHFASFEKKTVFLPERGCYHCTLHYPPEEETELLIRLLSFGPVIRVKSPQTLVQQICQRVQKQSELLGYLTPNA